MKSNDFAVYKGKRFDLTQHDSCLMWSHGDSCKTRTFTMGRYDTRADKYIESGILICNSHVYCKLIATGYLRRNLINPRDISDIIGVYLAGQHDNYIEFVIKNNHKFCMILFPGMKQLSIKFNKMFSSDHGCRTVGCTSFNFFHCGMIGVPQQSQKSMNNHDDDINNTVKICNKQWNLEKFYKVFAEYLPKTKVELTFDNLRDELGTVWQKLKEKDESSGNYKLEMELIDCDVTNTSLDSIDFQIVYGDSSDDSPQISLNPTEAVPSQIFAFENGDAINLEYDDIQNTFCVKFDGNARENRNKTKDNQDYTYVPQGAEKISLKKGFDYVLACCIYGCHSRYPGKNNIYTFSNTY